LAGKQNNKKNPLKIVFNYFHQTPAMHIDRAEEQVEARMLNNL